MDRSLLSSVIGLPLEYTQRLYVCFVEGPDSSIQILLDTDGLMVKSSPFHILFD